MAEAITNHDAKMKRLLDRCGERGVKLNGTKFLLKQTSVPYIGHILTSAGVKPDPAKIEAIITLKLRSNSW
ncbi:Retrovirus-related Pol poly from transposon [Paramuricea clavata]|uniref:Retrovirus-related Pol poly from transposon n=1 Tax=Paramuricea clavata TaxID=317549 RepID=A0A7D9D573_PARCT|nr:Retrovirus-related Pol poly from transposon [Paramuricea clavata]